MKRRSPEVEDFGEAVRHTLCGKGSRTRENRGSGSIRRRGDEKDNKGGPILLKQKGSWGGDPPGPCIRTMSGEAWMVVREKGIKNSSYAQELLRLIREFTETKAEQREKALWIPCET